MTSTSPITDRVTELHTARLSQPANEATAAFTREQAALSTAGIPTDAAQPGTRLSDTPLLDVHGNQTTLHAVTGGSVAVLVFYRGAWCPYCNIALSAYQQHLLPALTERHIPLIAISPQTPDGSLTMQEKHDLTYTVVSDPGNHVARALGILTQPSEDARTVQLQHGLDLTTINADGTTTLPMPTTVILDADHTIRWIDVHPDYTTRTEPQQILDALDHHAPAQTP